MIPQADTLSPVSREDIRADPGCLLHLRRVLQSSLQRRRRPGASEGVQAAAGPVAFERFGHVFPGLEGDHAAILRGSREMERTTRQRRKCVQNLPGGTVSRGRLHDIL